VGHGSFLNGLARDEGLAGSFSWIYDCGSKRTTRINQEIASLEGWEQWPEEVDLLVLSHFDDDHVNGVERLLRSRRVRVLALPYMDVGQSLVCAASFGRDPCSASTAAFQLDPAGWLLSRGLAEQVDTVLLVQGGPRGDDDPPVDGGPVPLPGGPDDNQRRQDGRADFNKATSLHLSGSARAASKTSTPRMLLWRHVASTAARGIPLELTFFNATQPSLFRKDGSGALVARRSRGSISVVQGEVDAVVRRYGLHDLSRPPRRGWRDALRAVYVKHFGGSSQQRNNISLCLLVRPLCLDLNACVIFSDRYDDISVDQERVELQDRGGLLLLGDLRVDRDTIAEMQKHFGSVRWADIGTVQVPHHGSRYSWEAGAAASFSPDRFVHCVPDASSHHPHQAVGDDLRGFSVHCANYQTQVAIDYHFD